MNHNFGLSFDIDMNKFDLVFSDGIKPEYVKEKKLSEMKNLYSDGDYLSEDIAYKFFANIYNDEYRAVFDRYGYSNGITMVMPERVNGECRKNSGHYHLISDGHTLPYMECYEILEGEAAFLLQKSTNFLQQDESLEIVDCVVVTMKKGDKIIVPPFYAHCAVNIGMSPMLFGNLAAPCSVDYSPIEKNHGFFTYIMGNDGELKFSQNLHYQSLPKTRFVCPKEAPEFGLIHGKSLNESFVEQPDIFRYLDHPEEFTGEIEKLLV